MSSKNFFLNLIDLIFYDWKLKKLLKLKYYSLKSSFGLIYANSRLSNNVIASSRFSSIFL